MYTKHKKKSIQFNNTISSLLQEMYSSIITFEYMSLKIISYNFLFPSIHLTYHIYMFFHISIVRRIDKKKISIPLKPCQNLHIIYTSNREIRILQK